MSRLFSSFTRFAKGFVGTVAGARNFRALTTGALRRQANVVFYHYAGANCPHYASFYSGYTLRRFESDLKWLREVFDVVSLSNLLERSGDCPDTGRPRVAVTFDDGFDLKRLGIAEVLAHYRLPASTFVVTSCIGNKRLMWRHKLSAIKNLAGDCKAVESFNSLAVRAGFDPVTSPRAIIAASLRWCMDRKEEWTEELWRACDLMTEREYLEEHAPYASWSDLVEWKRQGHEVGFHTHTHADCSALSPGVVNEELIQPASELKNRLGVSSIAFSYPFGRRLPSAAEASLWSTGLFTCMLGVNGSRDLSSPPAAWERVNGEDFGTAWALFGRTLGRTIGLRI